MRLAQVMQPPSASDSCLPEVDEWLQSNCDHWGALEELAPKRAVGAFRSVVDFLLCEACPEWRYPCKRFYSGKGKPVRELTTPAERKVLARRVLVLAEVGYALHEQRRRASWAEVKRISDALAHEAA